MRVRQIKTSKVRLAYEESGPKDGEPLMLVHGWPDSPRTWDGVLPTLHGAGYRTVALYLRGYGPSRFRRRLPGFRVRRTGQPVAFAADVLALADRLDIGEFQCIGHDWGAWTGYALAALAPERLRSLVAISVPYHPAPPEPPTLRQARAFWYQWLLCTRPGEQLFRADPVAFGRAQWDAWSPQGWYRESDFQAAARSWQGEDFKEVVLHSYRSTWGHAPEDPEYATMQARFGASRSLAVPTLLLHGEEDSCELAERTQGAEQYFSGPYRRVLMEGVGHFPQREAPETAAAVILEHLRRHRR